MSLHRQPAHPGAPPRPGPPPPARPASRRGHALPVPRRSPRRGAQGLRAAHPGEPAPAGGGCPSFGVNLVAVARHASLAQRREGPPEVRAHRHPPGRPAVALGLGLPLRRAVAAGLLLPVLAAAWGVLAWSLRADRLSALDAVTDSDTARRPGRPAAG